MFLYYGRVIIGLDCNPRGNYLEGNPSLGVILLFTGFALPCVVFKVNYYVVCFHILQE